MSAKTRLRSLEQRIAKRERQAAIWNAPLPPDLRRRLDSPSGKAVMAALIEAQAAHPKLGAVPWWELTDAERQAIDTDARLQLAVDDASAILMEPLEPLSADADDAAVELAVQASLRWSRDVRRRDQAVSFFVTKPAASPGGVCQPVVWLGETECIERVGFSDLAGC